MNAKTHSGMAARLERNPAYCSGKFHGFHSGGSVSSARRCSQCRSQSRYRQRSSLFSPSVLPSKWLSGQWEPKQVRLAATIGERRG